MKIAGNDQFFLFAVPDECLENGQSADDFLNSFLVETEVFSIGDFFVIPVDQLDMYDQAIAASERFALIRGSQLEIIDRLSAKIRFIDKSASPERHLRIVYIPGDDQWRQVVH